MKNIAQAAAHQQNHEPDQCSHPSTIHDSRTDKVLCRKCKKVLEEREH